MRNVWYGKSGADRYQLRSRLCEENSMDVKLKANTEMKFSCRWMSCSDVVVQPLSRQRPKPR